MPTELFPVDQIDIKDRVRYPRENLEELKASIARYGLCQPILINQHNILIDGWRRFSAWSLLKRDNPEKYALIPVHRRESMSEAEYFELELETNFQRLEMGWREIITSVCRIHLTRVREAAINHEEWTQTMTGVLLGGYSHVYVSNCLILKPLIANEKYTDCASITDAMRVYYRILEDRAIAEQAKRTGLVKAVTPLPAPTVGAPDLLTGLLAPEPTDETERQVDLSHSLFQGDCLAVLKQWPEVSVDHIITDPPYAIEMDNLDQSSTSLIDTIRIADEHEVLANLGLLNEMMSVCYHVLRDGGYFLFFCDQMNWEYLFNAATNAGFGVQRWPLIWCKTQAKNQMAHVNITKATEIVMVCRKGKAQLPKPVLLNWHIAPNDEVKVSNPFAKPFEIWKFLYEAVSVEGQTILDPFAGEGSGVISGLRLNRRTLGVEVNTTHFNYMVEQVKNHWKSIYSNVTFQ